MTERCDETNGFEVIQKFITETTLLTQRQLYYCELAKVAFGNENYLRTKAEIKSIASENVDAVCTAIQALRAGSENRMWVEDPASGNSVPAEGLEFSMLSATYIAQVAPDVTWIVADGSQLSLRPHTSMQRSK